jgi:hypothetical protein
MNRFDEKFNDIDPVTSRPFSGGHPDGVWIIAILYGIIALVGALFGCVRIVQSVKSGSFPLLGIADLMLVFGGYVPAVVFLFRRSAKAVAWLTGLFILVCVAGAVVLLSGLVDEGSYWAVVMGAATAMLGQGYIMYYGNSLRKDGLLF